MKWKRLLVAVGIAGSLLVACDGKQDYIESARVMDYFELQYERVPHGTVVKLSGRVISGEKVVPIGETFFLMSEDGDEMYLVKNNNVDGIELYEGEYITIYGGYAGVAGSDIPAINLQIIEK